MGISVLSGSLAANCPDNPICLLSGDQWGWQSAGNRRIFAICSFQVAGLALFLGEDGGFPGREVTPNCLNPMHRVIAEPKRRRPAYFWWLLANALALCFAVISWAVCLDVFRKIEVPRNYEILGKLGRLPKWVPYTVDKAPNGNVLGPKELYQKFYGMGLRDAARWNSLLLKNYLTNSTNPLMLTYIEGDYQVETVRTLTPADFLDPGFVVRAQALVKPDEFSRAAPYPVYIEYLLPTADVAAARFFKRGDLLGVQKSPGCASVVAFSKIVVEGDAVLLLTVIPIAYGPYLNGDVRLFEITPPPQLRPGAGFPVFKNP